MTGGETSNRRKAAPLAQPRVALTPAAADLVRELREGRTKAGTSHAELAARLYSSKASVSRWLNGTAVPTREQAVQWAKFCGTDEQAMGAAWDRAVKAGDLADHPAQSPAQRPEEADVSTGSYGWRRLRPIVLGGSAVVIVAAVAIGALNRSAGGAPLAPSAHSIADTCGAGTPATVSVPPQTQTTSVVTVHIRCPAPPGHAYILMVEVLDVGADHHSLYLAKEYLPPANSGQDFSFIHDVTKSPVGVQRLLYVVEVTNTTMQDWQNRIKHNVQLDPPEGARVVSNRAPNVSIAR